MTREELNKQIQPQPVTLGPVTAAMLGKDGAVIKQLLAEIERLKHDNHNLNWALGSPGYDQMATPEEEAEHVAAVAEVTDNIERMRRRKERHAALVPDGEDYLDVIERLRAALKFYADKDHFNLSEPDAWDTVSDEPSNWWCDEEGTATVEDGTFARMALEGKPLPQEPQ